jgi:hypothetical protein
VAPGRRGELEALADPGRRLDRLRAERIRQVRNVAFDVFEQDAWTAASAVRARLIYALSSGDHRLKSRRGRDDYETVSPPELRLAGRLPRFYTGGRLLSVAPNQAKYSRE